jgi:uncharacterized protein (DUF1697 family)
MATHAAFIRGINVGGKNMVRMAELARVFVTAGFTEVSTYIQSGNVAFAAPEGDSPSLAARIMAGLRAEAGLGVAVIVKSRAELERIIAADPFAKRPGLENGKRYVAFLSSVPGDEAVARLEAEERIEEEYYLIGEVIYTYYSRGYGKSYFSNNLIEKRLGLSATSRVWATLLEMARITGSPIASP